MSALEHKTQSVIGFYPGGGGNRYLRYLQNKEYHTPKTFYDSCFKDQSPEARYLIKKNISFEYNDILLTHCMNQRHIRDIFGAEINITILNFPLKKITRFQRAEPHLYDRENLF